MKIGWIMFHGYEASDSMRHVQRTTYAALQPRHEILLYPGEYAFQSARDQRILLREWMAGCDVIIGPPDRDNNLLPARRDLDRPVPLVCYLFGRMSRIAGGLQGVYQYLHTYDVLLGTCEAEVESAKKFFPNALTRCVPYAFDESLFYPETESVRQSVRDALKIDADENLLLYVGRITIEKNLHTLLKAFHVVLNSAPRTRLVIVGQEANTPFIEFGSFPVDIKRMLMRLMNQLALDQGPVIFAGHRTPNELRAIYNSADLLVNLTLHHDENFGLTQVEAMACGLPVVGTRWGGLKDTIIDGVTGLGVPTVVTPTGTKVDWWRAANCILELLTATNRKTLRCRCATATRERYSMRQYGERLDEALATASDGAKKPSEHLRPSTFATTLWATCARNGNGQPPFRRGPAAMQMYQELLSSYASEVVSTNPARAWCLPSPLTVRDSGKVLIEDPIFPLEIAPPKHLTAVISRLIEYLTEHPVSQSEDLTSDGTDIEREAVEWMHQAGLILECDTPPLDPDWAAGNLGRSVISIQQLDYLTDIVSVT